MVRQVFMIGELMPDKFELTFSYARISFIFYEKLMSFLDAAMEYIDLEISLHLFLSLLLFPCSA